MRFGKVSLAAVAAVALAGAPVVAQAAAPVKPVAAKVQRAGVAKEESKLGLCELPLVVINNTEFQFKTSRSSHALPIFHPSLHHYLTLLTQLQIRSTCSFCDSSQHRRHH